MVLQSGIISLVMRQVLPSGGAQADGKSTPHSQIWYKIPRPVTFNALRMVWKRGAGEMTGS